MCEFDDNFKLLDQNESKYEGDKSSPVGLAAEKLPPPKMRNLEFLLDEKVSVGKLFGTYSSQSSAAG